jgi:beta-alanine degradation protein BauB
MTTPDCSGANSLSRRQVLALLAAFGVTRGALAQDAPTAAPRSYRVVLENDRVRVLEYKSRPGFGVCGEGMHSHPDHVTVSLTGAKLKVTTPNGKATFEDIPAGTVFFAPAEVHSAEIIGGFGTRSYIIELKGKDWKPSTGSAPV